jgi:hypothetical protein
MSIIPSSGSCRHVRLRRSSAPMTWVLLRDPVLAFCNTEFNIINKLVTQNLRIEIMSIIPSYGSCRHVRLRHSSAPMTWVLLRDDSKVLGHPLATEPVPGLQILNQPIDHPLKVLVLGQVDHVCLCGLHLLLQHLRVECGHRYAACVLEGVLDHLSCNVVEHEAGFDLANSVGQMKMFLRAKEN